MNQCEVPWIHLDPLHANRFDDGVAVNCSDCSSSSSSGNSDITDPGSPFSVSSDDSSPSPSRSTPTTFPKMPPVVPLLKTDQGSCAGWPWAGAGAGGVVGSGGESDLMQPVSPVTPPDSLPAAPTTASKCNLKRKLSDDCSDSTVCVQIGNPTAKKECCVKTEDDVGDAVFGQPVFERDHRGKITHYYKPQKRADEKRIPLLKAVTLGFAPFMSTIIASKGSVPNVPAAPPDKAAQSIKSEPVCRKVLDVKCAPLLVGSVIKVSDGRMSPSQLPDVVPKEVQGAKLEADDKRMVTITTLLKSENVPEKMKAEPLVPSVALCWEVLPNAECAIAVASIPSAPAATPNRPQSAGTPTKPVSNTTPTDRIASQSGLLSREKYVVNDTRTGVTTDTVIRTGSTQQLSVSTASALAPSAGPKSPILAVPKSIRFPARSLSKPETDSVDESAVSCQWTDCSARFDCDTTLLEHLHGQHVNSQKTDSFVCLWSGCKVYGRTSCSRSWLERHVLSHGGNKPFRCIVDGCGMRFSSQLMLERHVNWHFRQTENPSASSSAPRRSVDTTPNKLFKRCGKKLRYRRQPWSARQFDFIDAGIMEGLQHRLILQAEQLSLDRHPGCNVTLQSQVIAKRVQSDGNPYVLLRWFPRNIVDDEWVLRRDVRTTRTVRLTDHPESLSSTCSSLDATPPSSPASSRAGTPSSSLSSAADSGDEETSDLCEPTLWVLKAAAELAAAAVNSKVQQSRKSRRKPIKKAAVT